MGIAREAPVPSQELFSQGDSGSFSVGTISYSVSSLRLKADERGGSEFM